MKCLDCQKLDLKTHPAHAKAGLGKCKHSNLTGVFVSFEARKECQQFEAAPADQAEARKTWWAKLQDKNRAELAQTIREEQRTNGLHKP